MSKKPENLDLYDEHEEVVSEGGKKVRRRGIFLLPNLLTTASLFAGFFSIVSSVEGNFIYAGMAVFVSQIFYRALENCRYLLNLFENDFLGRILDYKKMFYQ